MIKKTIYFISEDGIRIPAVTREQMIEIDRIAVNETGPNLFQMMENAGRNLAELTIKITGNKWMKKEIVVLSGKGNNGGGGICAARHLVNHGGNVKLVLPGESKLNEISTYQKMIYDYTGGKSYTLGDVQDSEPDIIIDSIIGYNLKEAPKGIAAEMIKWADTKRAEIISLDIPSGIDSTTGETPGNFIKAAATLTLALPKTGLLNSNTRKTYLGDIGIPLSVYNIIGIDYESPFENDYVIPISLVN